MHRLFALSALILCGTASATIAEAHAMKHGPVHRHIVSRAANHRPAAAKAETSTAPVDDGGTWQYLENEESQVDAQVHDDEELQNQRMLNDENNAN